MEMMMMGAPGYVARWLQPRSKRRTAEAAVLHRKRGLETNAHREPVRARQLIVALREKTGRILGLSEILTFFPVHSFDRSLGEWVEWLQQVHIGVERQPAVTIEDIQNLRLDEELCAGNGQKVIERQIGLRNVVESELAALREVVVHGVRWIEIAVLRGIDALRTILTLHRIDLGHERIRRSRVVALQRADAERAETIERQIVRDPRAKLVPLIGRQVAYRIVLRESLELRILLRAAGRHRSGVCRLADGVAAQLRVSVIPANVQAAERPISALQDDRLIGAAQIVAVHQKAQIDVLPDQRIEDMTGAAVGDAGIEVVELPVLIISAQERIRTDRAANAERVLAHGRRTELMRNLRRDPGRPSAREERRVVLPSDTVEPTEDLPQRFGAVHASNGWAGVDPVKD